jgi:hypothetical protein
MEVGRVKSDKNQPKKVLLRLLGNPGAVNAKKIAT